MMRELYGDKSCSAFIIIGTISRYRIVLLRFSRYFGLSCVSIGQTHVALLYTLCLLGYYTYD